MNEIDTYQAGRELDALIAKEVFGYKLMTHKGNFLTYRHLYPNGDWAEQLVPHYSNHNEAAFLIVGHLCQDNREPHELYFKLVYGWWYKADREAKGYPLVRAVFDWKETGDSNPLHQGLADTIALAICRAALRVVRDDVSLPEIANPTQ